TLANGCARPMMRTASSHGCKHEVSGIPIAKCNARLLESGNGISASYGNPFGLAPHCCAGSVSLACALRARRAAQPSIGHSRTAGARAVLSPPYAQERSAALRHYDEFRAPGLDVRPRWLPLSDNTSGDGPALAYHPSDAACAVGRTHRLWRAAGGVPRQF